MRRIHLLDPQLADHGGHYFNHDCQLAGEARRRGCDVSIYGRKSGQIAACANAAVTPLFSHDIFRETAGDPLIWPMENFHSENQAFLHDLLALDPSRFAADDLIYFPNILQNQVHGVALWLRQLPPENRPAVAVMFRYLNHAMDYVQKRQNKEMIALYYRYAVRELRAAQPRSLICADTAELARAYQQITGAPVLELPNPMDVSALLPRLKAPAPRDTPVVVYQGHTSPLRGFHFLPEIIDRCARLPSPPRFVVQLQNRDAALAMGLGPALKRLEAFPAELVRLVPGALSQTDYFALLAEADVVLLPYSPTFYGCGSSGVFTEAASLGKAVVVSNSTVPARQGREYGLGVVTAESWSAPAMADAVAAALRQLPELRRRAEAAAPRFRRENCAEAFWAKLLAAASALPAAAQVRALAS